MSGTGIRSKSGGAVGGAGTLFLVPNRENSGNPLLPLGQEQPPPPDAWDHFQGDEIELVAIPTTAQNKDISPPGDFSDPWDWNDTSDELEDFSTDKVGADFIPPSPDDVEWPWADGHELDEDWAAMAAADSAPVGPNSGQLTLEDPWDHWSEEIELLGVPSTLQALDVSPPGDSSEPWTWDDAFDDDWPAIVDDDDDGVGADFVAPTTLVEDPWYWDDDSSELEDFGTDPVGANVDPVQEDPWVWDDSFDDEAGIFDFAEPVGANVAPVPEDPVWDWSENVSEDDSFDLAQPVGANVDPCPDDIEWPWVDGHELDEDWPALTFDSAPVGANVDPSPEDPWDWSEFPDDDAALDFEQPQPIDVPTSTPPPDDSWYWDDDGSELEDFSTDPVGANVDPIPEDPWLWDDAFEDEAAIDFDQPLGRDVAPVPEDPWYWDDSFDDESGVYDLAQPLGANVDPIPEDPWSWDDSLEDEWEGSTDPVRAPESPTYQDEWYWDEAEDEWPSIIDDDDDAISADAVAGGPPDDPWDHFGEDIALFAVAGTGQNDQSNAPTASTVLCVEDAWDHFREEIETVSIPGTSQQSLYVAPPAASTIADSDENFHFYISDVEVFHADHFDNYDTDNALGDHEWHWEEVEDESFFGTDPIKVNAVLFAPAFDEPWPHFENPLGDEELDFGTLPVGPDLEPCPPDAWEWTEDTGDDTSWFVALDIPQEPPQPINLEDPWPHFEDTGEETGDLETQDAFDMNVSPRGIEDPWSWEDDWVDETALLIALDAYDLTTTPASMPAADPWEWNDWHEDPEPDQQHALIDIVPDIPTAVEDTSAFDWPAEDAFGDDPSQFGNAPVGPDGCPSCANTAKRWFGPTFVKFLQ